MSVSFNASFSPILGWDVECVCGATFLGETEQPMTRDQVETLLQSFRDNPRPLLSCEEGDDDHIYLYSKFITEGPESDEINMANVNAAGVLEAVAILHGGVEFADVCCGSMDAEDFLGRILMHLAVAPTSTERPVIRETTERGATFVVCGVPEGYVQDKLLQLQSIAQFAIDNGRRIQWG